ncbi:MAG: transglycosylase SLT domain-containing protein [Terriglobales bacterium]
MSEANQSEPFYPLIARSASANALPWWLLYSVIEQESDFNRSAVSCCGALGLMQLMPSTFPAWARTALLDPRNNVKLGASLLRQCIAIWTEETPDEAMQFGLASYNGGSGYVLAAQQLAQRDGLGGHVWAEVAPQLSFATCKGKHCDADQIRDYVARIWARFSARRVAPIPVCQGAL